MSFQASIYRQMCEGKCQKMTPFTLPTEGRSSFCVYCKWCVDSEQHRDVCVQCLQYGVFNGSDVCATCGQSQVVESFSPPLLQELLSSDLDLESVKRTASQFFRKTVLGL